MFRIMLTGNNAQSDYKFLPQLGKPTVLPVAYD